LPIEIDDNKDGRDDKNSTYYYAHHLCAGGEKNAQRNGSARNFSVCFSSEHHCPVWVAAPRHRCYQSGASRTDAYAKDPQIPSDIQYSSKSTGGGCNKGHMLGSADRLSSTATNKQVFYYSNIAPQYSDTFNTGGGAWNNLEDHIDDLVCSDTLYVVIGCYFDQYTDKYGNTGRPAKISYGGRSDVSRPTMFYYALLRTKSGSSGKAVTNCSASELQCAAFVICHEQAKGHKPEARDLISISELEKLTGFTYFPNVPNAPKSTFNANDWL
jgi:DNA/RNA endonuclease G (NUC1)